MKKLIGIVFVLTLLGCSSGGGSSPTAPSPAHVPVISNLQYSPASVAQGSGGGATTVTGTFDFADNGGDVVTLNITSAGSTKTSTVSNTSGVKVGNLAWYVVGASTATKGVYPFQIQVVDSQGNASNALSGTFTVY